VVSIDGREVKLTATEHALLRLLVQHAGKVLPHQQILREVWGPKHLDRIQYLRAYMARLREKLQAEPSKPSIFLTEPGIGYRLVEIERKPRGG
jgi:two-component system KDP operon response regulator KdpE